MAYLIDATDKPGSRDLRARVRPDHLAFLDRNLGKLIAAGAKLDDDGASAWGSMYIVDVEERAAAEAFIAGDPYVQAGLFATVVIARWRKAIFDFQRVMPKN